jgi:hypothetical protein
MSTMRVLRVWFILAGLLLWNAFLHFAVLRRVLPPLVADVVSGLSGLIIVIAGSRPFLREERPQTMDDLYRVSGIWLILSLLSQAAIGLAGGLSWRETALNYAAWEGPLFPVILIAIAAAPFIWLPRETNVSRRTMP